jgi:hypothetical protein
LEPHDHGESGGSERLADRRADAAAAACNDSDRIIRPHRFCPLRLARF